MLYFPINDFSHLTIELFENTPHFHRNTRYLNANGNAPIEQYAELVKTACEGKKKNIVLFSSDHWGDDENCFLHSGKSIIIEQIYHLCSLHPNKHFFIFTSVNNLDVNFANLNNVLVILWEELVISTKCSYLHLEPQKEKTFTKDTHWLYCTNNPRMARFTTAMYLLGLDTEKTGFIRYDPWLADQHKNIDSLFQYYDHNQHNYSTLKDKKNIFSAGLTKIHNRQGFTETNWVIQNAGIPWRDKDNFNKSLRDWYKFSFVEVISETIFMQPQGLLTEKYFNSVYGFTIPIILSFPGAIKNIRQLGFDVFDDVVDHSYDLINDPYLRLTTAIDNNIRLLVDREFAIMQWQKCFSRMEKNYIQAERFFLSYKDKFTKEICSLLDKFV